MKLFLISALFFIAPHTCAEAGARIITSHLGEIRGKRTRILGKGLDEYLGIPYSKPLTSEMRFKKGQPVEKYNTIIEAYVPPPKCPQSLYKEKTKDMDENCLFLNIWNPDSTYKSIIPKPVMFWFEDYLLDYIQTLEILSSFGDVIVVSGSFRKEGFGYLTTGHEDEPGDLEFYDQVLALLWVQENIGYFGGDPSQVTIFGQSAGGSAISYHILSGKSKGLFKRAIIQSGIYDTPNMEYSNRAIQDDSLKLAVLAGCASPTENFRSHREKIMQCLRGKSTEEILAVQSTYFSGNRLHFVPEGQILTDRIFDFSNHFDNDVEIIMGTSIYEGLFHFKLDDKLKLTSLTKSIVKTFARNVLKDRFREPEKLIEPYFRNIDEDAYMDVLVALSYLLTDFFYICPSIILADTYSSKGGRIHYYLWSYRSKDPFLTRIAPEFFYAHGYPLIPKLNSLQKDIDFSKYIMTLWTDFAKGKKLPEWDLYKPHSKRAKILHPDKDDMIKLPQAEMCTKIWKPAFKERQANYKRLSSSTPVLSSSLILQFSMYIVYLYIHLN